jgi:hypothetical protein
MARRLKTSAAMLFDSQLIVLMAGALLTLASTAKRKPWM